MYALRNRDVRARTLHAYALFALVFAANVILTLYDLFYLKETTCATLSGINVLSMALLLSILALQAKPVKGAEPGTRRRTPLLYSTVGVMVGTVALLSAVMCLQWDVTLNALAIFILCVLQAAAFIYIVYLRDHFYVRG